jgi:inosine-uridine nucleoside N-ribohydrolase
LSKEIVLDVDAGVDDALAILLAVRSPELRIRAITTVSGNVHVDKTSINVLKVLEAIGVSEIPVAKGMAKPLLRHLEVAEDFHGKDGLGDSDLPPPKLQLDKRHAVDLLLEETSAQPGKITVVATCPLTNIATALLREPRFAENVRELVIMGGAYGLTAYGYGNANAVAEFNIYVDPEAASIVFRSGIPLTCVGLDVTTDPKATLTMDLHRRIDRSKTDSAKIAARTTRQLITRYGLFHLHDPMAVAEVVDPSLFTTKKYHVDIETVSNLTRGQTVVDRRDWLPQSQKRPPNSSVCTGIDGERFLKMFMQRVSGD